MELEHCVFLDLEVYLVIHNSLLFIYFFFISKIWRFIRGLFSIFFLKKKKNCQFFLKQIRCSKYKQQGIVKVSISYQIQNLQCSIFKIATCEAFLISTKILSFSTKKKLKLASYALYKKKSKTFFFHILYLSSNLFQSFRSYNNFFFF